MHNLNFKLTDNDVFEDNPELLLIPEFKVLTSRQMRYVMLVDWYGSPLRLMKVDNRKLKAAYMAGYKSEKGSDKPDANTRALVNSKVVSVEAARRQMKEIQHDNEMDLKEALDTQIEEVINFFKKPDKTALELDKAVNLMTKLPAILETKRKIMELLNFREPNLVVDEIKEEETESSFLDNYMETN